MTLHDLLRHTIAVFAYLSRQRTFSYKQWHRTGQFFTVEPYVFEKIVVASAEHAYAPVDHRDVGDLSLADVAALPKDTMLYQEATAIHLDTAEVHRFRMFDDGVLRRWHGRVPDKWRPCASVRGVLHDCDHECDQLMTIMNQKTPDHIPVYYNMFREGPSHIILPPQLLLQSRRRLHTRTDSQASTPQRREFHSITPLL